MMKTVLKFTLTILIASLITGCASGPTHLKLVINSSNDLNPDINNVSSPLMLSFYELESGEDFLKYDYWTILAKSGKNLSRDLISQSKHVITPNQKQTYKVLFDKRTKFLGVVGKFRNIKKNKTWKHLINLEQESYNYAELKIKKFDIERVE